jgi:nucleotide-binding universal stress UspA family protein
MALETILVAVGPGDPERSITLMETVVDIAGPTGAEVVLAHVFDEDEYEQALKGLDYDSTDRPAPEELLTRYERFREMESRFDANDIDYSQRGSIHEGDEKGEAIVDMADEIGAGMVFVGGRKRSPAGKAVFGSTPQYVMLNAPCPVTFVRSDE